MNPWDFGTMPLGFAGNEPAQMPGDPLIGGNPADPLAGLAAQFASQGIRPGDLLNQKPLDQNGLIPQPGTMTTMPPAGGRAMPTASGVGTTMPNPGASPWDPTPVQGPGPASPMPTKMGGIPGVAGTPTEAEAAMAQGKSGGGAPERLLAALRGIKAPPNPEMPKVGTPAAPRPTNQIKQGQLLALLQMMGARPGLGR